MDNGKNFLVRKSTDGYANLRIGVVKQAIDDYKRALIRNNEYKITTLEHWFLSEWGEFMSGDNGAYIIEKVRKELNRYG